MTDKKALSHHRKDTIVKGKPFAYLHSPHPPRAIFIALSNLVNFWAASPGISAAVGPGLSREIKMIDIKLPGIFGY